MEGHPIPRAPRRRGQEGFTLVELILATMVFAIGMVAVLGSLVAIINHGKVSRIKHRAALEIQNQFEVLRASDSFPRDENLLSFDINDPTPIELNGLAGSEVKLFVVRPDDPDTGGDETAVFELPITDQTVIDSFGDFPGSIEVMMEALVPTGGENSVTFYRFRLSTIY